MNDTENYTQRIDAAERLIGYTFADKALLLCALTHSSYLNEHDDVPECYERLEFLGDSVLAFVSSRYLYEQYGDLSEGELTKLRARVICECALAEAMGQPLLQHIGMSRSVAQSSARTSILADTFESVAAAILLDGGFDAAKDFILGRLVPMVERCANDDCLSDYKSRLQELVQAEGKSVAYEVCGATGPDHMKTFRIAAVIEGRKIASGSGSSKKAASQEAAKAAIDALYKDK